MSSSASVSKTWRRIRDKIRQPATSSTKAPADSGDAIRDSTNVPSEGRSISSHGIEKNPPNTAPEPLESNDSQAPQEDTEDGKQTDPPQSPEVLHDSTAEFKSPAEKWPPSQQGTPKDPPASPRASNDLVSGSELPTDEKSMFSPSTPGEGAAELWARAYDRLRDKKPELVLDYTMAITKWLSSIGISFEAQGRRPSAIDFSDMSMPSNEQFVRPPLNRVVAVMLEEPQPGPEPETGSETESETESEPNEEDSASDTVKEHVIGSEAARSISKLLREALRALPHASMAWAATYITLQNLLRPLPQTEAIQSQILSVVSKMEWFTELFRLFFWPYQAGLPIPPPTSPVDALIALYESVLAYHMQVAVEFNVQRTLGQPQQEESRLKVALDELQACELLLVSGFGQLRLQQRLAKHLDSARTDHSNALANNKLREALNRLNVDQQPMPNLDGENSYLLKRLYGWASETLEFQRFTRWDGESQARLLWVDGPPGAGTSMLLQAAVRLLPNVATSPPDTAKHVAYFFCDDTMRSQGDISSTLKGLISVVLLGQPNLGAHLDPTLDERGNFDAEGDAHALSAILYSMIQDSRFNSTYFVLDGIQHFTTQHCLDMASAVDSTVDDPNQKFSELRRLIATTVRLSQKVKWLLSVECERHEAKLTIFDDHREIRLTLDKNKYDALPEIAQEYTAGRISNMRKRPGYNDSVRKELAKCLEPAEGNYLLTNMALDIVGASTTPWNAIDTLHLVAEKPSIHGLCQWNHDFISKLPRKDSDYCRDVLYAAAAAYGPLPVSELVAIIELPPEVEPFLIIEKWLPTFLEIREDKVYFKHPSAKIFIQRKMGELSLRSEHSKIARQCLKRLLRRLHCNHNHIKLGTSEKMTETGSGLTISMWAKHLSELGGNDQETMELAIHLLSDHLIGWLELLGAEGSLSNVSYTMPQLKAALERNAPKNFDDGTTSVFQIVRESTAFMMFYKKWKALPKEAQQPGEYSAIMSPEQRLLFAGGLPILRDKLLPVMFPRLQHFPILDRFDTWGDSLHVLTHDDWVRGCCFSPNGRTIASASDEGYVRVWDVRTGNLQQTLGHFDEYARGVVISSATVPKDGESGDVIAAFDSDEIKMWDATTGNLLRTLTRLEREEINRNLRSIALSPEADMLAAAVGDSVVIWQLPSATSHRVLGHGSGQSVRRVMFSPDGKLLASTAGSEITIWSTATGAGDAVCTLPPRMSHEGEQVSTQDGAVVASEARETTNTEYEQRGHSEDIDGLCFSPDSKFLVSGSDDNTARVWDVDRHQTVAILEYHTSYVNDVCFSHDGVWIATCSGDNTIALWKHKSPGNWGSGESRRQPDHVLRGHRRSVWSVSFSPPGGSGFFLVSASGDGDVRIWDMHSVFSTSAGQSTDVRNNKGHDSVVSCVAISQDGRTIASASYDGTLCCWDGQRGTLQCICEESHSAEVLSMTFSPDGQLLVTASIDQTAFVWEVSGSATKSLIPRLRLEHDNWVRNAQFDPRGRLVATADDDGMVRVYDVSSARTAVSTIIDAGCGQPNTVTLKAMNTLNKHTDYVYGVAFSPDSKRLASGGDDLHLMVWELGSNNKEGALLHDMTSDDVKSRILDVEFSANGSKVVSLSRDGTIAVWRPDALGDHQCQIVKEGEESGRGPFVSIRIDPQFPDLLFTELGAKRVNIDWQQGSEAEGEPRASWRPSGWLPLSVDKSRGSISCDSDVGSENGSTVSSGGASTIYLPRNFDLTEEPYSCRIQGNMVVVGSIYGHVLIFRFTAGG